MSKKRRPRCSAFSEQEVIEIRKIPTMMKIIIGLFLAILAGIFVPFQTISTLSHDVGAMSAVQKERQAGYLREREAESERLEKFEKKLYWIDRNLNETKDMLEEFKKAASAGEIPRGGLLRYGRLEPADIPSPP